ncbi:MAG: M14 family zinc carboxypeptidase [Woeseiaceae bacterium]|nr:M14 family zinc carboxypeptidase [Woeseiaceae bacterium]
MSSPIRMLASIVLACTLALPADARESFRDADAELYPTDVSYDPSVPTPEDFLGRPLGAAPVRHHELVDYINEVAARSERLTVEIAGYSHERRPILFVVATSPANQARIDAIRERHVGLTEPDVAETVTDDMPVVTWLNYGVHGAESSGMDASLPTVYYLAAARGPSVDRLLDESVILVTAIFNPDGHAHRIAWLDTFGSRIANPDPNHMEHDYDGRLARTNHYGFDLNRQWISATQPEARAWMRKWHEWRPTVSVDYHEMGSEQTYYFAPGIPSRNHPLIPGEGFDLIARVVAPSEAVLDEQKRLYFHGDRYDHFFLGKGAGLPMVNGGLGILHEASAARGVELETANGIRTYRENIIKHFRTSIGNATGAVDNRRALLEYQKRFYDTASDRADGHPVKAYVFDAPGDDARAAHFIDLLELHRIRVHELGRDITEGGTTYRAGDAWILPLDQPQHTMIRALFDRITEFEDTTFYDVSSWTVPLAFNLDYAPLSDRRMNDELIGPAASAEPPSVPPPAAPRYAYAFEWSEYYAPRALARILEADLHARVTLNPLVAQTTRGDVALDRGSIVVSFDRQTHRENEIFELMQTIAAEDAVEVHTLTSGRSAVGLAAPDIGGQFFRPLTRPEVLLIVGRDMDWYNAGEVWHLLDVRMGMQVTLRDRSRLGGVDLNRYTHIVYGGGDYENYLPEYLPNLRQWVALGGTLIGIRQGALWAKTHVLDYVEPLDPADPLAAAQAAASRPEPFIEAEPGVPERYPYAAKETRDALDVIGGSIFAGDLDVTHPLGFGYANRGIALHKNITDILERPQNPYASVITYATPPLLSGYASEKNLDALEGTAALIAERKGQGSIILFADDPNFRGIWYGTNKLFINALFFSKAFDPLPEE